MNDRSYFDPLGYESLGHSVIRALMASPANALDDIGSFTGVGIYALFYRGDFPSYAKLAEYNRNSEHPDEWPIYIGKAESGSGKRKGLEDIFGKTSVRALSTRIRAHRNSISQTPTLRTSDFSVRLLTMPPVWVPLAEAMAIRLFAPLWNATVDGFGNHAPGKGRAAGKRPMWDTLHPGRAWAVDLPQHQLELAQIEHEVGRRLEETYPHSWQV